MKQRRGIRRIVIWAGILLLLVTGGAIVNIAVAWGITLVHEQYSFRGTRMDLSPQARNDFWRGYAPVAWREAVHGDFPGIVGRWWGKSVLFAAAAEPDLRTGYEVQCESFGFPCAGLSLQYLVVKRAGAREMDRVTRITETQNGLNQFGLLLPIGPEWPGFAINTLFYAAILWLLFAAPFALRRWRRIKRGLCPACAYPIGTSDLCTECGKALPQRCRC